MAGLSARQLHARGVENLVVTSRTFDHAVALARTLGGAAVSFENYRLYLKVADIVIGSLAAARPVLERKEFEAVVRQRRYRPDVPPRARRAAQLRWAAQRGRERVPLRHRRPRRGRERLARRARA
jgi:hypothetical protein